MKPHEFCILISTIFLAASGIADYDFVLMTLAGLWLCLAALNFFWPPKG